MKPAIPWSVKGVEHETREAAKAAARRAGMTLGAWLNHMIQQSGDEAALARAQIALAPDPSDDAIEETADAGEISVVLNRLDALETQQNSAIEHLEHALEMLASRVPPQAPAQAATSLEPRLAQLEAESKRRFDRLAKELGTIATRYSDLEERQDHGRQEIAQLLNDVAKRPAPVAAGKGGDARLVENLERRLQAMDARLESVGRDARSAATTFQHALSAVMNRVVEGEKRQRQQEVKFGAHIDAFEDKIDQVTEQLEHVLNREGAGEAEAVHRLEQMVGAVTRQFEVVESRRERSHLAMEKTLRALAERLAETDRRHTQQVEEPLAALHQAVEDMSKRMAETSGAIEERLSDVTERMENGDTEFRASRFSMMHGMDDVRRRLEAIEATQDAVPPLIDEPRQAFAPKEGLARSEPAFAEPARERNLFTALAAQARARIEGADVKTAPVTALAAEQEPAPESVIEEEPLSLDVLAEEPVAAEPDAEYTPQGETHIDPVSDDARSDPVSTLLAAAREAARARAPQDQAAEEWRDDEVDGSFSAGIADSASDLDEESRKLSRRLSKGSSSKILVAVVFALVVIAGGVIALRMSAPKKPGAAERPGLMESLLPDRTMSLFERAPDADAAKSDVAKGGAGPVVASAPQAAVSSEPGVAPYVAPPEPASKEELAMLATSAIADVRAASTPAQMAKAAEKVTQAAMLGDAQAQFTLGRLYETGHGVTGDRDAARRWYQEAATQGHAGAQFNLGMMEARAGGNDAYTRAAEWFKRAAGSGYADAQYNLAMLYARGLGVEKNPAEAYAWFAAAAARGDEAAAAERDRLFELLDPRLRPHARALAQSRIQS